MQQIGKKLQKFAVRPQILGRSSDLDSQRPIREPHDLVSPRTRLNTDLETQESPLFMDLQRHASAIHNVISNCVYTAVVI